MSTPQEHEPTYAPPYGSAPAFSPGGYDGGYGGTPSGSASLPDGQPPYGSAYATDPYGRADTPVAGPPVPPPAQPQPPRQRRSVRGPISLLLACLLSGGIGGVVVHALDDDPTRTTAGAGLTRGTAVPPASEPGTTQAAAAAIGPSVVTIAVSSGSTGGFGRTQETSGTGSGIVIQDSGYIVTNNHVVAAAVGGGSVSVTFSDGSTVPAEIVGTDPTSDLAVVKVDRAGLKAAAFADSDTLVVGQTVIAVGAPLGLSNTVTEGIVSTLKRPVRTGEAGASEQAVIDAVQTDAAINPGNSGGALVDLAGQVVGVNSAIATAGSGGTSGNIGVGFAIPSNDVMEVAQELIASGRATHPIIGISAADAPGTAEGTPGGGALVQAVSAGGPASGAGLQQGDVITKVDDRVVTDADSLIVSIRAHDPGDQVSVAYVRDGQPQTTTATLAEAPPS